MIICALVCLSVFACVFISGRGSVCVCAPSEGVNEEPADGGWRSACTYINLP